MIFFGFIICFYLLIINIKAYNPYSRFYLIPGTYRAKRGILTKVSWFTISLSIPIFVASYYAVDYTKSYKKEDYHFTKEAVNNYLTLSNNQTNVIQFYFDRAQGMAWNFLLLIDYYINNKNSFIKLFPEFDSYINTLSTTDLTVQSNPVIYSGLGFSSILKEEQGFNKLINKQNDEITQGEWYFNSLKNFVNMLVENNISNIWFDNLPYYGNQINLYETGNMNELEDDFKKINYNNVKTMTNESLVINKDGFHIKNGKSLLIYDVYALQSLPNWTNFTNTKTGKYFSFFSQATHSNYSYINETNKIVFGPGNSISHTKAMWTTIQLLKPFLLKLKQTPFLVNGKPDGSSVYDHSLISIISDHGNWKKETQIVELASFLHDMKIITDKQLSALSNFDYYQINPVMMYKGINVKRDRFNFDVDKIISLSDHARILEIKLNQANNIPITKSKYFNIFNWIKNNKTKEIFQNQTLINPLDENYNSISKKSIMNRNILFSYGQDWRFRPYDTSFHLGLIQQTTFTNNIVSIFDNKYYTKVR